MGLFSVFCWFQLNIPGHPPNCRMLISLGGNRPLLAALSVWAHDHGRPFMVGLDPGFDNLLPRLPAEPLSKLLIIRGNWPSPASVEPSVNIKHLSGHEM